MMWKCTSCGFEDEDEENAIFHTMLVGHTLVAEEIGSDDSDE
jgi:hypothetical protein